MDSSKQLQEASTLNEQLVEILVKYLAKSTVFAWRQLAGIVTERELTDSDDLTDSADLAKILHLKA